MNVVRIGNRHIYSDKQPMAIAHTYNFGPNIFSCLRNDKRNSSEMSNTHIIDP